MSKKAVCLGIVASALLIGAGWYFKRHYQPPEAVRLIRKAMLSYERFTYTAISRREYLDESGRLTATEAEVAYYPRYGFLLRSGKPVATYYCADDEGWLLKKPDGFIVGSGAHGWKEYPQQCLKLLLKNYRLRVVRKDVIDGRPCRIVELSPRHGDSYIRRLGIDEKSGVILCREVLNEKGKLVASLKLRKVRFGKVPKATREAAEKIAKQRQSSKAQPISGKPSWTPRYLPAGFERVSFYSASCTCCGCGIRSQWARYTDGLAQMSVCLTDHHKGGCTCCWIHPKIAKPNQVLATRVGAINAVIRPTRPAVVVVGDMPVEELAKVAASVPTAK